MKTEVKTEVLLPSTVSFEHLALLLASDEVVSLPTETVYGLAGNAFSKRAVSAIFSAKERPFFDPLIVHISKAYLTDPSGLLPSLMRDEMIDLSSYGPAERELLEKIMRTYWPGPLTLILPKGKKIPDEVTANETTVALRCPDHAYFQAVLSLIPFPLAAPSANRFGRISPTEVKHVLAELEGRIPAVLDGGPCQVGVESTIISLSPEREWTLLRPGKISAKELESTLQMQLKPRAGHLEQTQNQIAPGMLDEHYAPRTPLYLNQGPWTGKNLTNRLGPSELQARVGILSMGPLPTSAGQLDFIQIYELSPSGDPAEMARNLYEGMRQLDANPEVKLILADVPPAGHPLSAAIRDRLKRASRNKPEV